MGVVSQEKEEEEVRLGKRAQDQPGHGFPTCQLRHVTSRHVRCVAARGGRAYAARTDTMRFPNP